MFWCNLSQKTQDKEDCSTWQSKVIRCWCVCLREYKAKSVCAGWGGHLHRTGTAEGSVWLYGRGVPWRVLWAPQGNVSRESFQHHTHMLTHRGCRCSFLWYDVQRKCKMDKLPTITFPSSAVIVISVGPLKRIIWSFLSLPLCVLDEYDYCFTSCI